MANKKKKRRHPDPAPVDDVGRDADQGQPPKGGANPARRERKEQARAAREAERKRAARSASVRRAAIFAGIGLGRVRRPVVDAARAAAPRPLPQAATNAIEAADCRYDHGPVGRHRPAGSTSPKGVSRRTHRCPRPRAITTRSRCPTCPGCTRNRSPETKAVHFLEHSGVIVYYRPGEQGVGQPVIDELTSLANDSKNMIVAPRDDLPDDTDVLGDGVEQGGELRQGHHAGASSRHRQRIRRGVRLHQQRARTRTARTEGRAFPQETEQLPPSQVMTPCSKLAVMPPAPSPCTREVGNPNEPVAAPRAGTPSGPAPTGRGPWRRTSRRSVRRLNDDPACRALRRPFRARFRPVTSAGRAYPWCPPRRGTPCRSHP